MNDLAEAEYCEAYALKVEGKLDLAGHRFMKINKADLARDCFWDGELWEELLKLKGEIKQEEFQLAQFMVSTKDDPEVILDFSNFIEDCIEKKSLGKSISRQWKNVISEFRQRIFVLPSASFIEGDWHRLGIALEELTERGFHDSPRSNR